MRFKLLCHNTSGTHKTIFYDNQTGALYFENGGRMPVSEVSKKTFDRSKVAKPFSADEPLAKTAEVKTLKIQLGLSCNYSCNYCSQRFIPNADETTKKHVEPFMSQLSDWLKTAPERIEFWGGEPLVYIKTLVPLAEALRVKFPDAEFVTITNGSLLTPEINEWIDRMGFSIGLSHDGPGQFVRGPDPLDDPQKRTAILDLYKRLSPSGRISFNAMLNNKNSDRAAIQRFFVELTGDKNVPIGEGAFIEAYDEGGLQNSISALDEKYSFRNLTLEQLRNGSINNFGIARSRIVEWVNSFAHARPAKGLGMKCGMDRENHIVVDLKGNVVTCQNVSIVSNAPNKESHYGGNVSDFEKIQIKTSTHWSKRESCSKCPMLQVCRGSCMFLEGPLFWASCENSFSDHVPFFAVAVEIATGYLPYRIEADHLPEHRKSIWEETKKDKDSPRVVPRAV